MQVHMDNYKSPLITLALPFGLILAVAAFQVLVFQYLQPDLTVNIYWQRTNGRIPTKRHEN
jgi:hypothetical protein